MLFLPRRWRIACFFIVTPFQIGIILTANLAFLNHLVLALGVLLLDDRFLGGVARRALRLRPGAGDSRFQIKDSRLETGNSNLQTRNSKIEALRSSLVTRHLSLFLSHLSLLLSGVCLSWVFYASTALLLLMLAPVLPLPEAPIEALEPFRIAEQYGLFAVMTRARYEIEFEGSRDGKTWVAYPFRYKPQDPLEAPRVYAPYQPRLDWNLWFAALGNWRENTWVVRSERLLLQNDSSVLSLFAGNPFPGGPPRQVRAVVWQYWFTDLATKRATALWWRRELRGLYAPTLEREPDGKIVVVEWPEGGPPCL